MRRLIHGSLAVAAGLCFLLSSFLPLPRIFGRFTVLSLIGFILAAICVVLLLTTKKQKIDLDLGSKQKCYFLIIGALLAAGLIFFGVLTYLGYDVNKYERPGTIYFLGVIVVGLGLGAPSIKMNPYFGLRLPWLYQSEDTWNAAHRMLGLTAIPIYIVVVVLDFIVPENWLTPKALFGFGLLSWIAIASLYPLLKRR